MFYMNPPNEKNTPCHPRGLLFDELGKMGWAASYAYLGGSRGS